MMLDKSISACLKPASQNLNLVLQQINQEIYYIFKARCFSAVTLGIFSIMLNGIVIAEDKPTWWRPTPGTSWQIQYSGDLDTSLNVQVYNIDLFDTPKTIIDTLHAQGKKVICYFSAGSYENWRPDVDKFTDDMLGKNLSGWPGERWLDIRRQEVLDVMKTRITTAADKGCDAVDPDNVDGYTNPTGFPLTYKDQLAYNMALADFTHSKGLAIGLKNDLEQISDLLLYFDFAVNEECFDYHECSLLLPFVNTDPAKAVFGIEYDLNPSQFCSKANQLNFDFLQKTLDLTAWRIACR